MKKKTYIAPTMTVTVIRCQLLVSASVSASGLDGFEGNGGPGSGKEADAREGFWDEEAEEAQW